jgi:hypothetical protein
MWFLIVMSSSLGTVDVYSGGNRRDCERLAQWVSTANPQPAQPDIVMACVEDSRVEAWLKDNFHYVPPSK